MPITLVDAGGVSRTITTMKVLDGTTLRTIFRVKIMDGTTLRTVATFSPPMSASASPNSVEGFANSPSAVTVTTTAATITPSGGTAPYSYAWAVQSYAGGGTPGVTSAASATTTFTLGPVASGDSETVTYRCTVTDAFGQTATADVTATFTNTDFS